MTEVYFTNHQAQANITNIYTRTNANVWSGNLQGAGLPHNLLTPAVIVNGDSLIFGIDTSLANSGPFSSAVFDVATAAVYGGNATCTWQYWNGAWVALATTDNTGGGNLSIYPFEDTGVNSVHWKAPTDWATANLNTIFGGAAPNVTGYWVRVLCNIPVPPGDSITTPTQQNRLVYSIRWPRVDIAADQVPGDIPTLAKYIIYNQSDKYKGVSSPDLAFGRNVVGLRTLDRGENFTAYINLADEQNEPGITVTPDLMSSFVNYVEAPSGRAVLSPAGSDATIKISFTPELATQYNGRYTCFLRFDAQSGSDSDGLFRVGVESYNDMTGANRYNQYVAFRGISFTAPFAFVELGTIVFPGTSAAPTEDVHLPQIVLETNGITVGDLYLIDFIMIPTDEWFGDFKMIPSGFAYSIYHDRQVDIDSLDDPKQYIRSVIKETGSGQITSEQIPVTNGQAIFQPNVAQRLWFFMAYEAYTAQVDARPEIACSAQARRVSRYLGMRGNR